MSNLANRLLAVALVITLTACAATPRVPLQAESKQRIKSVALVSVPDPDKYYLNPGQSPAGAALYLFGALGGLILGSIEASRAESATNEFSAALAPHNPAVGTHLTESLNSELAARGYALTKLPPLPKTSDGKALDCGEHKDKHDAILVTTLSAGYSVDLKVEPKVAVTVTLLSADCDKTLYSDTFIYTNKEVPNSVFVERSEEYSFGSRELLMAGAPKAAEALRTGAQLLAKRISQEM